MSEQNMAEGIFEAVLKDLYDRRGFKHWWDDIEPDIKQIVRAELLQIVQRAINNHGEQKLKTLKARMTFEIDVPENHISDYLYNADVIDKAPATELIKLWAKGNDEHNTVRLIALAVDTI